MVEKKPRVYIFHGDDEFTIAQTLESLKSNLEGSDAAIMDFVQLDGGDNTVGELQTAVLTLPFFAQRRMVVYQHPLAEMTSEDSRQKLQEILEKIPATTALVLVVDFVLTPRQKSEKGDFHWLEKWAHDHPEEAFIRCFPVEKGGALVHWIQERARALGGEFEIEACKLLAEYVGDDKRMAENEIHKLLAYVNYSRRVEREDVAYLTPYAGEMSVFGMVDALGNRNGKEASKRLHQLLDQYDAEYIFYMVVRQFRLLIQAKEILESGGNTQNITKMLHIHAFVAGKLAYQSRQFTQQALEEVYHKLVDIDEAIKTSQIETRLALDTLIASLAM